MFSLFPGTTVLAFIADMKGSVHSFSSLVLGLPIFTISIKFILFSM